MDENKRPPAAEQITMPGFEPPTEQERLRLEWERVQRIIEAEAAAEEQADIEAHKGKDPAPLLHELTVRMEEIQLMGERCSRPEAIAIVADDARRYALRLEAATGMEFFFTFAEVLKQYAASLKTEGAQEVREAATRSVVFTPDTTDRKTGERIPGREFILPDELAEYKKASPFAAEQWEKEHPQPTQADTIKANIGRVSFALDALKSPEDALTSYDNIPPGYFRRYTAAHFARLVQEVARQTGADPAQIADKDKRTPEQQQLLLEAGAREQIARMEAFLGSNYMQALNALDPLHGTFTEGAAATDGTALGVKEYAVLYFFAAHEDIKATGKAELTPEQLTELTEIYNRLDAFYAAHQEPGTDPTPETLHAFIEQENPDPNAAKLILDKLPLIQGIKPKTHVMPNNALMNALQTRNIINAGEGNLPVSSARGKRKEITVYTMVSYDPGETGITLKNANLTEYERQVSDAIVSLWLEAERKGTPPIFTPQVIFNTMPGGNSDPSPQQRGAITRTLDKFARLRITVDATIEARQRGLIGKNAKYEINEPYLSFRLHTVRVRNGATVQAYQVLSKPVILSYSQMTNQILSVSAKYLSIEKIKKGLPSGELIAMNADRQAMTGYLLRRIARMKHAQRSKTHTESSVILFASLFKETGTETNDRKQTMLYRNFCFDVLDYWKATGFIKGYRKQEKGRSITGIEILL